MYCSKCGRPMNDDARFCSNCGAEIQSQAAVSPRLIERQPTGRECPKCQKDDRVSKVAAVVEGGILATEGQTETVVHDEWRGYDLGYHKETVPISGVQVSELAARMQFPPAPAPRKFWCSGWLFLAVLYITLCYTAIGLVGIYIVVTMPSAAHLPASTSVSPGQDSAGVVISVVLWALGVAVVIFRISHSRAERVRVEMQTPLWKSAREKWASLYYCDRDHIVFDPASRACCEPGDAVALAYSLAKGSVPGSA